MNEVPSEPQQSEPAVIASHNAGLSRKQKSIFIATVLSVAIVAGAIGYGLYQNGSINAAGCVTKTFKSGAQDKCVGYAQKMLNGITKQYAGLTNNGAVLDKTTVKVTNKVDTATTNRLAAVRKYAGAATSGTTIVKDDWAAICDLARQAYRAYTADVRPSDVQAARDSYTKADCSSLAKVGASADDPAAPGPVDGASVDANSVATDTPAQDDLATPAEQAASPAANTQQPQNAAANLKIATWNIAGGAPENSKNAAAKNTYATKRSEGLASLAKSADVIALQESHITNFRKAITDKFTCAQLSCPLAGVDLSKAYAKEDATEKDGSLPASIPILWNKNRFTLKDHGVYTALKTGYRDASGDWVSLKWITWVKLEDNTTKKQFSVVNTHTVAGIEAMGKPKDTNTKKAAGQRLKTYAAHMDLLVSLVQYLQESGSPVFVTGDFNVNYRYDSLAANQYKDFPYKKFGKESLKSNYQLTNLQGIAATDGTQGTGTRLIDYIFSWDKGGVDYISNTIETNRYGSDHSPVLLSVKID